jgi:hypothetical protein
VIESFIKLKMLSLIQKKRERIKGGLLKPEKLRQFQKKKKSNIW